jgi:hypothetical protein
MRAYDLAFLAAIAFAACNSFTGVADLDAESADGGSTGSNLPALLPADGITLTRVEIYQGLQVKLMEDGVAVANDLPVVIGRDALFRLYYDVEPGFEGTPTTARLTIGDEEFEVQASVGSISNESSLGSTINIEVPGDMLMATDWRVDVLQPREETSGSNKAAAFPSDSEAKESLDVTNPGGPLRVRLVPVQYQADGSGRLPVTTEDQLELIQDMFFNVYPVGEVEIIVDDPFPWTQPVAPNGGGWGELLDAITNYRQTAGADVNEYFYGAFRPSDDFGEFCGGGCIAGLANLAGPGDPGQRAGIGLGFAGPGSIETAIHEVGHTHGRQHTPCGVSPSDPGFPTDEVHVEASIGRWGLNMAQNQLVDPGIKDFMSYCDPTWVSDYTFEALLTRIQAVNGLAKYIGPSTRWHQVSFDQDGTRWHPTVELGRTPTGEPRDVTLVTASGQERVAGYFFGYDHLDGGRLLFPATKGVTQVRLEHRGAPIELQR